MGMLSFPSERQNIPTYTLICQLAGSPLCAAAFYLLITMFIQFAELDGHNLKRERLGLQRETECHAALDQPQNVTVTSIN